MQQHEGRAPVRGEPAKSFFVEMLVRDISLEQAISDLVDNCVDGAKRMHPQPGERFDGRSVEITMNGELFRITDNCGGFDIATAREYAFRFGRPRGAPQTPHSIGQFGVGMKRALFKFGRHFIVSSATSEEHWAVEVDVDEWEQTDDDWSFPWAEFPNNGVISESNPGTDIIVDRLRPQVAARFATETFGNLIESLIKSKHRQFIASGLSIALNGRHIDATNLYLLMTENLRPGVDRFQIDDDGEEPVDVRIVVGIGHSVPREAGWYVVCNGRVVLEADRRPVTGWGLVEENDVMMPSFHNQFARFRGIVTFDSQDSSRVPWNTMKTDVDLDSHIWQRAFRRMIDMMRPVISFLNSLDKDIDEFTRERSPLLGHVNKASNVRADGLAQRSAFRAPTREEIYKGPKTVKIQYSRPIDDVELLQEVLGVQSAKAVGERSFDLVLSRQKG